MRSVLRLMLVVGAIQLSVSACGERDTICACIESGNVLNKKANAILEKGSTEQDREELKKLKADKQKKCAEFERMGGPEMRERMQECK